MTENKQDSEVYRLLQIKEGSDSVEHGTELSKDRTTLAEERNKMTRTNRAYVRTIMTVLDEEARNDIIMQPGPPP